MQLKGEGRHKKGGGRGGTGQKARINERGAKIKQIKRKKRKQKTEYLQ